MPYLTTKPGIREAVLSALQSRMVAKLADLNNALQNVTPAIGVGTVVSTQFYIGDFQVLPEVSTNPFWVTISKGGRADGQDQDFKLLLSQGVMERRIDTNIWFYLHPNAFATRDKSDSAVAAQTLQRELLRARFEDWLVDDVLNIYANLSITLTSQQFNNGTYDVLDECYIRSVSDGYETKGFGDGEDVQAMHFRHSCVLRGAS